MKVLPINFSPKKENGNTHNLLSSFLEGMRDSGAEVKYLHAFDFKIERCLGCMTCHNHPQAECRIKDDLTNILLGKAKSADCWVFEFPINVPICGSFI